MLFTPVPLPSARTGPHLGSARREQSQRPTRTIYIANQPAAGPLQPQRTPPRPAIAGPLARWLGGMRQRVPPHSTNEALKRTRTLRRSRGLGPGSWLGVWGAGGMRQRVPASRHFKATRTQRPGSNASLPETRRQCVPASRLPSPQGDSDLIESELLDSALRVNQDSDPHRAPHSRASPGPDGAGARPRRAPRDRLRTGEWVLPSGRPPPARGACGPLAAACVRVGGRKEVTAGTARPQVSCAAAAAAASSARPGARGPVRAGPGLRVFG